MQQANEGERAMSIFKLLQHVMQYILEAVSEIFSPNHDDYPAIGLQPFEEKTFKKPTSIWS